MSKLSNEIHELEMKASRLEYENKQFRGLLYRLITGNSSTPVEDVESLQFNSTFTKDGEQMLSVSVMRDYNLIATKPI